MTRCMACGHAYFAAFRTGHRSGLCAACRMEKKGGLGLVRWRRALPGEADGVPGHGVHEDDWLALHEAASLLGFTEATLQKRRWRARLGAVKVGGQWLVARAALQSLLPPP